LRAALATLHTRWRLAGWDSDREWANGQARAHSKSYLTPCTKDLMPASSVQS